MRKLYFVFAILFVFFACSKDDTTTPEPEPVQVPKYTVTIKAGDGGTVSSAGGTYNKDSQFSVTATPNAEYLFQAWSDGNTDNPRTIKVGADLTITANFVKKQYDLTVTVVGDGAVAEEVVIQGGRYNSGSQIKLTATAAEGSEFTSWTGAIESTDNPVTVTLNGAKEVTATFTRKKYDLTVTVVGEGTVTEEVVVQPGQYDYETQVKLTAVPETGWEFTAWSGDLESTENPVTVTVEEAQNITATFVLKDSDGDGVPDLNDSCPDTSEGETVDENGCSDSQKDSDEDGVTDDMDTCPDTPEGEDVDENGCISPIYLDVNGVTVKSKEWAQIGDKGVLNGIEYTIVSETQLRDMIGSEDVSKVVTSFVTNMSYLFQNRNFNEDIGSWDVSNVTDMKNMFYDSSFDKDISFWDVGNVTDMSWMFYSTNFNQDISNWDVSNVKSLNSMFSENYRFNQNIGNWDVSSVTDMNGVFRFSFFNQDIGDWDVSSVTDMSGMFLISPFNQDISNWDVSSVTDMSVMFDRTPFNQDISNWDVSSVTNMDSMFRLSTDFNQDISNWNVSNVTIMSGMFYGSKSFNKDISSWDVSNVTTMSSMFQESVFNKDISGWDVSKVTDMSTMFYSSIFNRDLSSWNVNNVVQCSNFSNNSPLWTLPKPNFTNCNPN